MPQHAEHLNGRRYYGGRNLARAVSFADLRQMAQRRLPRFVFEYLEGGAEQEVTLRRNRAVFDDIQLIPRTLVPLDRIDLSTTLLGSPVPLPVAAAPTGFNGLLWRDGDLALARACARMGVPFIQSTVSNARLEDVAGVAGLRHWLQLYVFRSQDFLERLIARAEAAGCEALVLTVDSNVFGNREWDKRNYRSGTDPTLANKIEALRHPRWLASVPAKGVPSFGNLLEFLPEDQRKMVHAANWAREAMDTGLDWDRVGWLRKRWTRPLLIKGLLCVDDVAMAHAQGADGVVLSNHGGRQLDGAVSPMSVLPAIAEAFAGRLTILVDSGFRRGTDVLKALALGADGVLLGRTLLYGLAAGGEAGAGRAFDILFEETRRAAALSGCRTRSEIVADRLVVPARVDPAY
ncbi:alpha-hydroxy acid oxidase [Microbaculum sp. FT89]|uniref:alpha-hydroxy acid oxidase n=1 Tax=Microbaculum sp. FT89 TaxID=3447298 RepID=UPI003F52EC96